MSEALNCCRLNDSMRIGIDLSSKESVCEK